MTPAEIALLAAQNGIALQFQDARGGIVQTSMAVQLRLLQAMGVIDSEGQPVTVASVDSPLFPPAMVVRAEMGRVLIDLDGRLPDSRLSWQLTLENGKRRRGEVDFNRKAADAGRPKQLVLTDIPYGYHSLELNQARTELIVTPGRCWLPENFGRGERSWGISLQLYLLRSANNWGIGDFADLAQLAQRSAAQGCDVLGLNPLHQMFPDNPEHASPYSPASRQFLNILYIAVEDVPEFAHSADAQALVGSGEFRDQLRRCRDAAAVDYTGVTRLKLRALRAVHAAFRGNASAARRAQFRSFVRDGGEPLQNTSLFQVLRDHFTALDPSLGEWQRWPEEFRSPDSAAVRQFLAAHETDVEFYSWTQWIADQQLAAARDASQAAGMRIGLYRDLAVGSDRTGAETWASPADFLTDTAVGAPPDILNPAGQNWGLPPLNPVALQTQGFKPFIDLVRSNMRHAGGLRIDHVMGLQRLYCIPQGLPNSQGAYVNYPIAELVGILALESHRHRCLVVGEDLGTVPAGFRERMEEANILSYRVLFFEHDEDGTFLPPERYPRLAVAVAGSHDMPTLRGWLTGSDIDLKHRLRLYPTDDETRAQAALRDRQRVAVLEALTLSGSELEPGHFAAAVHGFLGTTQSLLAMTQLDDLLDEHHPVNVPGTSTEHPNWRRKYDVPLEALTEDHPAWQLAKQLSAPRRPLARPDRRAQ